MQKSSVHTLVIKSIYLQQTGLCLEQSYCYISIDLDSFWHLLFIYLFGHLCGIETQLNKLNRIEVRDLSLSLDTRLDAMRYDFCCYCYLVDVNLKKIYKMCALLFHLASMFALFSHCTHKSTNVRQPLVFVCNIFSSQVTNTNIYQ